MEDDHHAYSEPLLHGRKLSPRHHSPPPPARDPSPDYLYSGGATRPSDPHMDPAEIYGAPSQHRRENHAGPGGPPYPGQPRIQYAGPRRPQSPLPPADTENDSSGRDLVPRTYQHSDRERGRGRSRSRSRQGAKTRSRSPSPSRSRSKSAASRAREALASTFSDSGPALGYSVLGAIVGGIAAREWADTALPKSNRPSRTEKEKRDKKRLLATLAGAAAVGLGVNALEKRFEENGEAERGVESDDEDSGDRYEGGRGGGRKRRRKDGISSVPSLQEQESR